MYESKKCSCCNTVKNKIKFSLDKSHISGLQARCKECDKKRLQEYRKTKEGLITHIYSKQKIGSVKRKHQPPSYSRKELYEWFINQDKFSMLFESWVLSGYKNELTPTVDRIDDYKGYSLDNIQLMTWQDNRAKYNSDRRNGINTKNCKAVLQFDLNHNLIREYHSSGDAARSTGGIYTTICQACRGEIKTSIGFIWEYKDEN